MGSISDADRTRGQLHRNNGIFKTLSEKQNMAIDNEEYGWEEERNKINQNMKHIFLVKKFKFKFYNLMKSKLYQNNSMNAEEIETWDQTLYVNQESI